MKTRKQYLSAITAIILTTAVGASAVGCKVDSEADKKKSSTSSTSSSGGSLGLPVGEVNDSGFYVQVLFSNPDITSSDYYMHEESSLTKTCKVAKSDITSANHPNTDIFCLLDMNELDLYFSKITMNFNSPAGVCNYTRVRPYSFWMGEPGKPAAAPVLAAAPATLTALGATATAGLPANYAIVYNHYNSATDTRTLYVDDANDVAADNGYGNIVTYDGSSVGCAFNYSDYDGQNCCEGGYRLITQTTDGVTTTTSIADTKFGGKYSNCLGGPAPDIQPKDKNGYPMDTIYNTLSGGVNKSILIEAPITKGYGSILYNTNYWNPNDPPAAIGAGGWTASGVVSFLSVVAANTPTAMRSSFVDTNLASSYQAGVSPYYEFHCLDKAQEYKARVRVLVRAWDTVANFNTPGTGNGTVTNPYTGGGATDPDFGDAWHDRSMWRDVTWWPGFAF